MNLKNRYRGAELGWRFNRFRHRFSRDYRDRVSIAREAILGDGVKIELWPDGWSSTGNIKIERHTRVSTGTILSPFNGHICIQKNCYVGPYCVLYGHGGIDIGQDVLIAGHTSIVSVNHVADRIDIPIRLQGEDVRPILIEDNVWIGAGCRILGGVTLGMGCIIGAGAVVTKSVPPNAVALGVPAKIIKVRNS